MAKKYNILFLSSWNPCPHTPTLGNFVMRHAESISLINKVFFILVCSSDKNEISISNEDNLQIIRVFYKKSKCRLFNFYRYFKAYLKGFHKIESKIDIVHGNVIYPVGLIAVFFKWKLKVPFVLTEHWSIFLSENKLSFWQKNLFKWIAQKSSYIAAVSLKLKLMMQKNELNSLFEIIYNAIDTKIFTFKEKKENDFVEFVHISTLDKDTKNIEGLLKAFKNLVDKEPNNHLTIISDGDISKAEEIIKTLKISTENIRLLKTQTAENIAHFLQSADAYLQFSNYETFGITMAEALCCGTPVISTKTGFLEAFDEKEIGLFVEKGNIADLTEKMKNIKSLDFPYKAQSLYFSKLFDKNEIAKKYNQLYQKVLDED